MRKSRNRKARQMAKRVAAALVAAMLIAALCWVPAAHAAEGIVLVSSLCDEFDINAALFVPWCASTADGAEFLATCREGKGSSFGVAYVRTSCAVLRVGESARFEAVTQGGQAPLLYVYDVYYQPFTKETRSYIGELHEVSTSCYLDFTPKREGRYILVCEVSDAAGSSVRFDTDAIPTDKDGEISAVIDAVAADALKMPSEYAVVSFLRDWLMDACTYNKTQSGQYEADSVLLDGTGVCSGYASAFNMLCSACGLESFSVHGYASAQPVSGKEHSWNCVKVEGDWYLTDITRDDNNAALDRSEFFLMTSATCEHEYCFGAAAGSFGAGGACLPPRCNATMYAEGYDSDPVMQSIEVTAASVGAIGDSLLVLDAGAELQLYGTTAPRCSRHPSKLWQSSDETVAQVDALGVLKALSAGRCSITLICGDFTQTINIEVR